MYDDLVKRLRYLAKVYSICDNENTNEYRLAIEAADAIEELTTFKAQITGGHFYCMRDGVLYEAKVEMPKGKSIQLTRIEFAEPPKEET